MSLHVTVTGDKELEDKARALLREASRFQRRVSAATGRAVRGTYQPTLIGMVPAFVPDNYADDLAGDLRVNTTVHFTGANPGVTAGVRAPTGRPKGRAVRELEVGTLRHPLFGNRNHWFAQHIRPGFASVPLRATRRHIIGEIDDELAQISRDVEKA